MSASTKSTKQILDSQESKLPPPLQSIAPATITSNPTAKVPIRDVESDNAQSLSRSQAVNERRIPTGTTKNARASGNQLANLAQANTQSQSQFISYNSFLRRSMGSRQREEADRNRSRRDSEGLAVDYPESFNSKKSLEPNSSADDNLSTFLPNLGAKRTATDFSDLYSVRAGSSSAFPLVTSLSNAAFPSVVLPPRSHSAAIGQEVIGQHSRPMKQTFITNTSDAADKGINTSDAISFSKGSSKFQSMLGTSPFSRAPSLAARKTGISTLVAQQNEVDSMLASDLLFAPNPNEFQKGHTLGSEDGDELDGGKNAFQELQNCMDDLSTALKQSERLISDQRAFLGSGEVVVEKDADSHQNVSKKKLDPLALRRSLPRKGRFGPQHTIHFGVDEEVEESFRGLLAVEGIDADAFLSPDGTNQFVSKNTRSLSILLDMLSKHTLKEEQQRISDFINDRHEREDAERQRQRAENEKNNTNRGSVATKKKVVGPAAPSNTYALLNEIHRRENNPNAKPRISLVERFKATQDLASKDGQLHGDGHTLHNGLTIKMILLRKIELLRRDKPLRLKFFEHVDLVQKQRRKEQDLLVANEDGCLDASTVSHNIAARNIAIAMNMSSATLEEERRQRMALRDDRMEAARQRFNENQARRRNRFVALVERARGIGYEYDTGLTDPEAQYAYGSAANDLAAWWMQLIVLSQSRLALAARMNDIMGTRKVHEAMTRTKAREDKSALKVQRWWKKTRNMRKAALQVSSILVVCKYLRALPKIQCRFRIAMHSLIHRVIRLQRHFRSIFIYRRLRYEHARKTVALVVKQEVERCDKDVAVITKERKKVELQLNAAIKSRKQHFTDLIKQHSDRILERSKQKEYLIAISDASVKELATLVMRPKERAYRNKVMEYAQKAKLKYLAATNGAKLIEATLGYLPPQGLYSNKEQDLIRRTYSMYIARPLDSLVVTSTEALGIIEERGYELGQQDFQATLVSNKGVVGAMARSHNSSNNLTGRPPSGSLRNFK